MTNARRHSRISTVLLAVFSLLSLLAAAQEKKEFRCTVGPGAVTSITNNYGPITVKLSGSSQVLVATIFHSDAVKLVNEQDGDRIELRSISSCQGTNLVEYTVLVPAAAFVTLRSSDGTLRAQGLRGDVVLEAASGSVEVTDISDAHLHVKTPMAVLVRLLSQQLGRIVLDKTGLMGNYDFTMRWAPNNGQLPMSKGTEGTQQGTENTLMSETSGPSIFTAIEEQLGLKLESQIAPLVVLVIDHAETPSEK
jgi:hypothetical protein